MADLVFKRPARKALRAMDKTTQTRVMKALEKLAGDPTNPSLDAKSLVNRPGFRLRIGDWRALYKLEAGRVIVLDVLPRGGAYRLKR